MDNLQFIIYENDDPLKLLGKKRFKENNGKLKSVKNNDSKNNVVFFNLKKVNNAGKVTFEDLTNLYNIKRLICLQCFKTTNYKYSNNEFIPSISF